MTQEQIIIKETRNKAGYLNLEYRLIESECTWEGGTRSVYSIFISVNNTETEEHEEKLIEDITSEKSCAEELFDLVFLGKFTPMTLHDVVSDFID